MALVALAQPKDSAQASNVIPDALDQALAKADHLSKTERLLGHTDSVNSVVCCAEGRRIVQALWTERCGCGMPSPPEPSAPITRLYSDRPPRAAPDAARWLMNWLF